MQSNYFPGRQWRRFSWVFDFADGLEIFSTRFCARARHKRNLFLGWERISRVPLLIVVWTARCPHLCRRASDPSCEVGALRTFLFDHASCLANPLLDIILKSPLQTSIEDNPHLRLREPRGLGTSAFWWFLAQSPLCSLSFAYRNL